MDKTNLEKLKDKFIFSIEGNIGAGKSTIIKYLQKLYDNILLVEEPVKDWQNIDGENLLKKKNIDMKRWGYSFEGYVLLTKMNELIKAADSDKKIILIERSMLTDKAFFDVNVMNGLSNKMEEAMFNKLYDFLKINLYPKLTGIIYVKTPVDACLERIKTRGRAEEKSLDKIYLEQLNETFNNVIDESGIPTLYIDGMYDLKNDIESVGEKLQKFVSKLVN